jgi:hypothetical protein
MDAIRLSLLGRRLRGPPPTSLRDSLRGSSLLAPRATWRVCLPHWAAGHPIAQRAERSSAFSRHVGGALARAGAATVRRTARRCAPLPGCVAFRYSTGRRGVSSQATTQKRQSDRTLHLDPEFNTGPKQSKAAATSGSPEPERTPHADPPEMPIEAGRQPGGQVIARPPRRCRCR